VQVTVRRDSCTCNQPTKKKPRDRRRHRRVSGTNRPGGGCVVKVPEGVNPIRLDATCADPRMREVWALCLAFGGCFLLPGLSRVASHQWMLSYCERYGIDRV
jgi:hypothetical protein